MNLKRLIKKGVDRNIVCYDSDAKKGILSRRLITLMRTIAHQNEKDNMGGELIEIVVPWGTPVEKGFAEQLDKLKLPIKFTMSKEYTDIFLQMSAMFPKNKKKCLIGICERGVLLGAY